jgi:modulator of FtsH protease HflC
VNRLFKNVPLLVMILLVIGLAAFSMTSIIRFTEVGVKTTFGKAGENAIIREPGLVFKAPYPIQQITKYDTRTRLVEAQSETQQTKDDFQIIVQAFLSYRVADPLKFFKSFSNAGPRPVDHFSRAENDVMRDLLRSALGETSRFEIGDLFSTGQQGSKLGELEARVRALLEEGGESGQALSEYGIEVVSVGIDRIILPEETTSSVIQRMGAVRDRLAERFESEGRSQAQAITAEANSNAEKILAFARRRADEILARGEAEAAPYLAEQNINPDLAVFIQNIKLMEDAMSKKFTLIFSTSDFGMQLFDPEILNKTSGRLPIPGSVENPGVGLGGEG